MPAQKPEDLHPLLATAMTSGDLAACLALYDPGAALAKQLGGVALGTEAIAAEIGRFLALKGTLTFKTAKVVATEDIALLHSLGSFVGIAPDGSRIEIPEHLAHEVAKRQTDGTWLFVVNDPWGTS